MARRQRAGPCGLAAPPPEARPAGGPCVARIRREAGPCSTRLSCCKMSEGAVWRVVMQRVCARGGRRPALLLSDLEHVRPSAHPAAHPLVQGNQEVLDPAGQVRDAPVGRAVLQQGKDKRYSRGYASECGNFGYLGEGRGQSRDDQLL
jgi:hypothetical protein